MQGVTLVLCDAPKGASEHYSLKHLSVSLIIFLSEGEEHKALKKELCQRPQCLIRSKQEAEPTTVLEAKRTLQAVINENPFHSKYFFWLHHEYPLVNIPLEYSWPDMTKLERLTSNFPLQQMRQGKLMLLGGTSESFTELGELFSLMQHYPEEENFLYTMARNTPCPLSYPSCSSLQVLSVCTKEISEEALLSFRTSCSKLGYSYKLLARKETWNGWAWRTKTYLAALKELPSAIIAIICDSTDLFFLGPARECDARFRQIAHERKIGSLLSTEENEAYPGGKYTKAEIQRHFLQRLYSKKDGEHGWAYSPNGGFLIGFVPSLIRVLEANQAYKDDQSGYCEMFYEGREGDLGLDTQGQFCATFPNIPSSLLLRERWMLDVPRFRITHRESGVMPFAAHFPGRNFSLMHHIYHLSEAGGGLGEVSIQTESTSSNLWFWVIVVIIVIALAVWFIWYLVV